MGSVSSFTMFRRIHAIALALSLLGWVGLAGAQDSPPQWLATLAKDPQSPEMREFARMRKEQLRIEQDLKKIRRQYFHSVSNIPKRQEGLAVLRDFKYAAAFEPLIEIFGCEGTDTCETLLSMFSEEGGHAGQSCIAWLAVYGCDDSVRDAAKKAMRETINDEGEPPLGAKMVIYSGLRSKKESIRAAAAGIVKDLQIISAIPWLIATQVGGGGIGMGSADRGDDGDLAWIAIGTQQSFVSDLTPVVGPSAVAFDPQLSVVTSGTLIRIQNAIVYEYHYEIHNPLVDLTSSLTDTSTQRMGWDADKWKEWLLKDFPALREAKLARDREATKSP